MNITEKHNLYLNKFKKIYFISPEIKWDQVLYLEIFRAFDCNLKHVMKDFLFNFFFDMPEFFFHINQEDILFLVTKYYRSDHDLYWKRIRSLFSHSDEIFYEAKISLGKLLSQISLKHFFYKIKLFYKIWGKLESIDSKKHKMYFSNQIMKCYLCKEKLSRSNHSPKVVISFFDAAMFENFIIQYLKTKGTVSITNQHGQPVYRGHHLDHYNQSQILNFTSDYFIAKGLFTKEQFIKAGVDSERIKVLGGFEGDTPIRKTKKHHIIGIFLDCIEFDFALESNKMLIDIAEQFSKETGYQYFIKVHPTDSCENYKNYVSKNCIEIINKEKSITELIDSMAFGLLHASAIYVDIILREKKAYKLISQQEFPLVENPEDLIQGIEDLKIKYHLWKNKSNNEKSEYYQNLKKRYVWSHQFKERYIDFVETFIK